MESIRRFIGKALRGAGYQLVKPGDLDRLLAERKAAANGRQDFVAPRPFVKGLPPVELTRVPAVDRPERQGQARRLLDAYKLASSKEPKALLAREKEDLWTNLVRRELGELLDILAADDASRLASYLLRFGEQYTWFGGLTFALDGYIGSASESRSALIYLEKLVCLAEAVGALPIEHPEHGRWGENIYMDVDKVISGIEQELGVSISPPEGAVFVVGIRTDHGVFHYRHLNAIYTAHILSTLVPRTAAVAEYGGGLGAVAFYARRMGINDYTLFDLPITNIFAGHFLINALGSNAVTLFGETPRNDTVKVMPFWTCRDVAADAFDLSLNQDSFPEIDAGLVGLFLKEIRRTTSALFLSINHEAQSDMTETEKQLNLSAMLKGDVGYRRLSRKKYWLREGYAEELYRVSK